MKRRKAPNLLFGLCVHAPMHTNVLHAPIHTNVYACTQTHKCTYMHTKDRGKEKERGEKERRGGGREKGSEGGHFLKGKQRREGVCHH